MKQYQMDEMSLTKDFGRAFFFWVHGSIDCLSEDRKKAEILNEKYDQTTGRMCLSGSVSRRKHISAFVCHNCIYIIAVAGNGQKAGVRV